MARLRQSLVKVLSVTENVFEEIDLNRLPLQGEGALTGFPETCPNCEIPSPYKVPWSRRRLCIPQQQTAR